jgi:hypothetical protein
LHTIRRPRKLSKKSATYSTLSIRQVTSHTPLAPTIQSGYVRDAEPRADFGYPTGSASNDPFGFTTGTGQHLNEFSETFERKAAGNLIARLE